MTIHRYLAKRYLIAFLQIFLILCTIIFMIELAEQLRRYFSHGLTFAQGAYLSLLLIPTTIQKILPFIILFAALALFFNLTRRSETISTRAAGLAAKSTLIGPLFIVICIGLCATLIWQPLSAIALDEYANKRHSFTGIAKKNRSLGTDGIWTRQTTKNGIVVINAEKANYEKQGFSNVNGYFYKEPNTLYQQIFAEDALLLNDKIILFDVKRWDLRDQNPEKTAQTNSLMILPLDREEQDILLPIAQITQTPFFELPAQIAHLRKQGLSANAPEMRFYTEFGNVIIFFAMLICGAALMMRPTRLGQSGLFGFYAILFAFGTFFLNSFIQIMGINGQLPTFLAAFSTPIIAFLFAFGLLLQLEDG